MEKTWQFKGEDIHSLLLAEEEEDDKLFTTLLIRFHDGRQKYFEFVENPETAYRIKMEEDEEE